MTNFSHEQPPVKVYDRCVEQFGVNFDNGVVFTVGNTVYSKTPLSDDLVAHEETHVRQQKDIGVDEWWDKYLSDESFRLEQEVEAYRNQYQYCLDNYNRRARKHVLKCIANSLSGSMYGNLVDYDEAVNLITQ